MGQFVGFSDERSSLLANVQHMSTNFISPQFHVVFDDLFKTVNHTGIDEPVVKAICQGLSQHKRELYADKELNKAGNIIYQPPPLHKVWLNEAGRREGNKDRLCKCHRNDNLMSDCNHAVKKVIPTPVATDNLDNDNAPDVTQISDDSSVDSLLFSCDLESEGGIQDNTNNNDVSFTPEGGNQNVIPPNNKGIRAPVAGLPINCDNEGVNPLPNNVPDPNPAPEGARHQRGKAKQYLPAIWQCSADGKLKWFHLALFNRNTRNSIAVCLH